MARPCAQWGVVLVVAVAAAVAGVDPMARGQAGGRPEAPARLPDAEFRRLIAELSEPEGAFPADNLVSNEGAYQHVLPALGARWTGGAYIGVGPDQNFTYVAALRPEIAFVLDIRRDNLLHHLIYKALFEASEDRATFASRLFARPLVTRVAPDATAEVLFASLDTKPDAALANDVLRLVERRLITGLQLELSDQDLQGIRRILEAFAVHGPSLSYASTSAPAAERRGMPTFAELQGGSDLDGRRHGYLATAEAYATMRAWQAANLVVPVVGDFAGGHALASIGRYLDERGIRVGAFYASNVEEYLFGDGRWPTFYATLGGLPLGEPAFLIRATSGSSRLDPIAALLADVRDGRIRTYADITGRAGIR